MDLTFASYRNRRPHATVTVSGAGVIDEVGLNVHPLLPGSGVPLFRDAGRIPLDLLESRVMEGGCVLSRYRVRPG